MSRSETVVAYGLTMISIRFFGAPRGPQRGPRAGRRSGVEARQLGRRRRRLTAAIAQPRRSPSTGGLEADDAAVGDLADHARVDQQVDVADDLREGQERLGDRDVAPQLLGELVGGPRLLGDQAVELLGAALVQREPLVDQRRRGR